MVCFLPQDMGNESGLAQVTPYKLMEALKDSIVKQGRSEMHTDLGRLARSQELRRKAVRSSLAKLSVWRWRAPV